MKLRLQLLPLVSLGALVVFFWPFWMEPQVLGIGFGAVLATLATLSLLAITFLLLDGELLGAKQLAMLGTLAALGAAVRVGTGGVAGLELVFVVVILGGAAYGARFGFLLGSVTILVSSLFLGGIGPWTPLQVFATAWVGAGAALARQVTKKLRIPMLVGYGIFASYLFGLLMNLWFWPSAVGISSSLSYQQQESVWSNLASFLSFSLISSTLTWDTVRAVSVALVLGVFGRPALRALDRAKI